MNQLGLPISLDSKMLLDNFLGNKQLLDFIDKLYVEKPQLKYMCTEPQVLEKRTYYKVQL